ncbi:hypothetical protein [Mesorhizobium sp.]|uniref:hypothetical protein n=1 Tax=Mesorhizobium sp. TaxID=1871066 RepID=UPI002579AF66|nr:hypothetical protein [Mesorhizobium sp.]
MKFALFAYDNAGFSKHILNCLVGHIHGYPPLQRHGSIARLCNRLVAAIDQCATTTILGQHGARIGIRHIVRANRRKLEGSERWLAIPHGPRHSARHVSAELWVKHIPKRF